MIRVFAKSAKLRFDRNHTHGTGGLAGVTEKTDNIVGFAMNHVTDWIMSAASETTLYYQDKEDGYKPKVMQSIDTYQKIANKYTEMADTVGVYWEHEVKTNADKIRSMTDEELADLLTADCKYIPEELCRKYLGNCDACLREWLKQKIVKE